MQRMREENKPGKRKKNESSEKKPKITKKGTVRCETLFYFLSVLSLRAHRRIKQRALISTRLALFNRHANLQFPRTRISRPIRGGEANMINASITGLRDNPLVSHLGDIRA